MSEMMLDNYVCTLGDSRCRMCRVDDVKIDYSIEDEEERDRDFKRRQNAVKRVLCASCGWEQSVDRARKMANYPFKKNKRGYEYRDIPIRVEEVCNADQFDG